MNVTMSSLMHIKYTVKITHLLLKQDCEMIDFGVTQVKGTVQGVNFRAWTQKQAQNLNTVTGWVMNTPDGHVIGEALGPKADIETL